MKGMVFTEYLDMVEKTFGLEITDQMITACDLPSGGAYTAVGTYDHQEIVQLVQQLHHLTGMPLEDLLKAFGRHLFKRFVIRYPEMFEGKDSAFSFLEKIDSHIHVEVRKLYPDAELPSFECSRPAADELTMLYHSNRGMADLAEGLIQGCGEHFRETLSINRQYISDARGAGVLFSIKHQPSSAK